MLSKARTKYNKLLLSYHIHQENIVSHQLFGWYSKPCSILLTRQMLYSDVCGQVALRFGHDSQLK